MAMNTHDSQHELSFDEPFFKVLEHYETKLKQATEDIATTIKKYLGKRTIAEMIDKSSPIIKAYNPKIHYLEYQSNHKYQAIKDIPAISFLSEYSKLPSLMISKGLVFCEYFNFIALISNQSYLRECFVYGTNIDTVNDIAPEEVFQDNLDNYHADAYLFVLLYLDAKLFLYINNEEQSLEGLTYRALLSEPQHNLQNPLAGMKGWLESRIYAVIDWNNFNGSNSNQPWGNRSSYLKRQIAFFRGNSEFRTLIQNHINTLANKPSEELLEHFDELLCKEFKLIIAFKKDKTILLTFTWDTNDANSQSVKHTLNRAEFYKNRREILKKVLSKNGAKKNSIEANHINAINRYFWNSLLLTEFITVKNDIYGLNEIYTGKIEPTYSRTSKKNEKKRVKRKP
jgi:hypothetical protein